MGYQSVLRYLLWVYYVITIFLFFYASDAKRDILSWVSKTWREILTILHNPTTMMQEKQVMSALHHLLEDLKKGKVQL